ncbi:hypothetical protein K432DRAFT_402994 [Lepidopterella palustris CBS 459.81]|uniref:BRCT domain-containing protein n=1 Tax=Lepidopterella palustris CBS 459.81 TaxID=1314670 RepID=A0A8E2JH09_9PEZI|nr:hypothetical protein K432DRAFT_402994 [Lepidopterella palustris CBS 459.81]
MLDNGYHGRAQTPLAGVVLCCTSIPPEQRTELATVAIQMGAVHKYDLTSDVTHLVVGNIDTPKYKYVARERPDVIVVTPAWLEAVRLSWMEGGDTDVVALEQEHRVPTFQGLKICVTGFDENSERQHISSSIVQNGAEYHGDLTKSVTHLIAARPSGSKYAHARKWGLKIVSYQWFQHSIERGMVLEEDYYDPIRPVAEHGKGAWNRATATSIVLAKRNRDSDRKTSAIDPNPRRKLRRSASSKLGSQNGSIWADITAGGIAMKTEHENECNNQVDETVLITAAETEHRIANNPATEYTLPSETGEQATASAPHEVRGLPTRGYEGIFQGRVVFVQGFDNAKSSILWDHLTSNGAAVLRDAADVEAQSPDSLDQGFLIVPADVPSNELPALPEAADRLCKVTNWWVERCLHGKCLVDSTRDVLCKPFKRLGIDGFNGMIVGSTSFTGVELLHVSKVVNLMGATYDEYLTATTSVLVCNSKKPSKEKLCFALERNIPAVSAEWLWDCLETGEKQPFEKYILPILRDEQPNGANPFIEVPTAPLSEEDSARLRKRKQSKAARPSGNLKKQPKDKSRNRRARTLELCASNAPTPTSTDQEDAQSVNDLDTPTFPFDDSESASAPLQELPPEVNSPRRRSATSLHSNSTTTTDTASKNAPNSEAPENRRSPDSVIPPEMGPTPDSVVPPDHQETLNITIANLLAQKQAASAAASAAPPAESNQRRRKRGLLGRATSGTSNPSASTSFSRADSSLVTDQGVDGNSRADDEGAEGKLEVQFSEYMPSQSLLYEDPEVQAARENMIRKMGGKVEEAMGVVGPIGVVRDVVSEGVAGRMGRRRKG